MGCPACRTDYELMERKVSRGEITAEEDLLREIDEDLYLSGASVIYCPSCREKLQRLNERIAARLRRQTLDGIDDLLGRALNERRAREKK